MKRASKGSWEPRLEDFLIENIMARGRKEMEGRSNTKGEVRYGVGLDVGTGFILSSCFDGQKLQYRRVRNCFVTIKKQMFKPSLFGDRVSYMDLGDSIVVIGEDAMEFAKIRNTAAQRPLSRGILNPTEKESAPILKAMFRYAIEECIKVDNEKLVFSIPGKQLGNPNFDTTYHSMSMQSLCKSFGVDAEPVNEAFAVAVSEVRAIGTLTALSFSFGAGLTNTCLTYKGIPLFDFSIDRAGDFIDKQAAQGIGESEALVCHIKEKELDLSIDEYLVSPEKRALIFSYRFVVQNVLAEVQRSFSETKGVRVLEAIPVVVSGGTSMPKGFLTLFKKELETANLPFEVSEVIHVKEPLQAVAEGCWLIANDYYKGQEI